MPKLPQGGEGGIGVAKLSGKRVNPTITLDPFAFQRLRFSAGFPGPMGMVAGKYVFAYR